MYSRVEVFYNFTKKEPILIAGATGVGKSLFLHIFEKLYQEKTEKKGKIPRVNCSHFSPELGRSELFGHVRGAFTGAINDKEGWIRVAAKARLPLILDEIGDLRPEVQANLLTFMEDGKFFKVGSTQIEEADVQIIGATNKAEELRNVRNDFWQRFLSFYIPPIHQRRGDILYYFNSKFPEFVKTLTMGEVLALLSYNWPGNVREIERVARLLQIVHLVHEPRLFETPMEFHHHSDDWALAGIRLSLLDPITSLTKSLGKSMEKDGFFVDAVDLEDDLKKGGLDVQKLNQFLKKYRIGINRVNTAFPELSKNSPLEISDQRFEIKRCSPYKPFEDAFSGLTLFCFLFFRDTGSDQNVLKIKKGDPLALDFDLAFPFQNVPSWAENLRKQIFEYLSGIHMPPRKKIPQFYNDKMNFFNDLANQNPSNEFLASITGREARESTVGPDIFSMTDIDFHKYMYRGILDRCGGNQKQAAARLGLNYNTFRGRLRKIGII